MGFVLVVFCVGLHDLLFVVYAGGRLLCRWVYVDWFELFDCLGFDLDLMFVVGLFHDSYCWFGLGIVLIVGLIVGLLLLLLFGLVYIVGFWFGVFRWCLFRLCLVCFRFGC